MTLAKRSVRGLMLVITFLASLVVPSGTAHATSDYDDLLQTSSSLFVYTDGAAKTQQMDVSQTWLRDLGQTYAKRNAQSIGWPTNFMTELNDIRSSGGSIGVLMRETPDGNMVEVIGSRDPNAHCGFVGSASTGLYQCSSNPGYGYVRAGYFTHNSYGGNGCYGSYVNRCSNNGMNIYDAPIVETGTAGYTFFSIWNSSLSAYKFHFLDFNLTYPSGYDGEMIPTTAPGATYVAMGDSYSSGVGTFSYDSTSGSCLRSANSYVSYVANQHSAMGTPNFVACGGATTADLYGQNPNAAEPRQFNALTSDTQYVTMTIGGNDVGFSKVMERCANWVQNNGFGCATDSSVTDSLAQRINTLAGTGSATSPDGRQITALTQVLADTASAAPSAKIYIAGYPRLFGDDLSNFTVNSNAPGGAQCNMSTVGVTVSYSDAQWLNQKADELNGVIQSAVNTAQANDIDVTFVPAALFGGHGQCDSDTPWLNGVVFNGDTSQLPQSTPESMHPTSDGYQSGYGVAFATIVN